jgi:hypothetical protein
LREIGGNSNSCITFDVINELCNPDLDKGEVISIKLRRLVPFSSKFPLRMRGIARFGVISNITKKPANPVSFN